MLNVLVSYTKGASLLIKYSEEYLFYKYDPKLFDVEKASEILTKIEGFYVFYDILFFKDRPYREIERIWSDFGMSRDEIWVVVSGTRIMRNLPIMDYIKDKANVLKNNFDIVGENKNVDINRVLKDVEEFHSSFYSTMNSLIYPSVFLVSLLIGSIISLLSFFTLRSFNSMNQVIDLTTSKINLILKGRSFEKLDIIDPSSECIVLQDAVNTVSEKFKAIQSARDDVMERIVHITKKLETEFESLSSNIQSVITFRDSIGSLEISELDKSWSQFMNIFSVIDASLKSASRDAENLRSLSLNIFEPVSSIYDILSSTLQQFSLINEIFFRYISETGDFVNTIQISFKREEERINSLLSEMKRVSMNLRSLGINASVEFSKIPSGETLTGLSSKIVDLSKDISSIFGSASASIENFELELKNSSNKILSFINSSSQIEKDLKDIFLTLKTLSSDRDNVSKNIENAYKIISDVMEVFSKLEERSKELSSSFYRIEQTFKQMYMIIESSIKSVGIIESFAISLKSLSHLIEGIKNTAKELEKI
ncbi:MAG: hypothetical protein N3D81_01995 [Spirochaetes bacterium]|nr:hypothetical protein [Spirochaetota bacterium]